MVKLGYKQTEIGVIPEDWDIGMFKNVGEFFKGSGISMRDVKPTGFPCIMYGDIYVKFDTHFKKCDFKIDENTAKRSTKAISNDLFFTASGETAEEIGKCVSYQGEEDIFIGGDIIAIRPKNEYNSLFLSFVQNSSLLIKQKSALAQGHTVVHINRDSIASLVFAYPELQEQERIAEALSDVDELISSLEKLIEKYKSIKATCLQQMFPQKGETTPKMRLPGFTGAWEQRKLGEVGKCQSGIGFPDAEQGGKTGTPFYKVSDMNNYGNEQEMTCANNYVTDEQIVRKNWKPITEVPAVIFAKVGAAIMLNRKRLCRFPFLLDNNTMAYKFGGQWDTNFGKTLFEKIDLTELVQVGALPSYNATDVENLDIKMPADINEQKAIGEFFTNLDNLITLHQRKLDKAKKIKQGMMQQLLTGKIRLL